MLIDFNLPSFFHLGITALIPIQRWNILLRYGTTFWLFLYVFLTCLFLWLRSLFSLFGLEQGWPFERVRLDLIVLLTIQILLGVEILSGPNFFNHDHWVCTPLSWFKVQYLFRMLITQILRNCVSVFLAFSLIFLNLIYFIFFKRCRRLSLIVEFESLCFNIKTFNFFIAIIISIS